MKIWIIGLGNGRVDDLPLGIYRLLQSDRPLFVRTADHPLVSWLQQEGIKYQTFDASYERHDTFAPVYDEIVQQLLASVCQYEEILYAVPGHPSVAEQTVKQLLSTAPQQGVEVEIKGGQSFLDPLFTRLGVDPIEGFVMFNGESFTREQLQPSLHTVICQVYDRLVASDVKLTLMEVYPDETPVTLVQAVGLDDEQVKEIPLYQLDQQADYGNFTSLYIPPYTKRWDLTRSFSTLVSLFAHLRSPEGCPWDRKQTHRTLKRYLLEETYEVLEAIDEDDPFHLAEELGDLLLQVLFHAQIASEQGEFDIYDVIEGLNSKLIRRHPHVFASEQAETAEAVEGTWDRIKQQEKGDQESASLLAGIPKEMSALAYAWELQKRAAKVGFDWDEVDAVYKKIEEECEELRTAQEQEEKEKELGDLLFTAVNLSRFYNLHPELALTQANQKFRRRFAYIEQQAQKEGKSLVDCSLEEMDQWWEETKKST